MDIEPSRETILAARQQGYSIAIDDFGTGYSSLQYLLGLPVDALKIDKSSVTTIGRDAATSTVIFHIIEMAKSLNLHVVAEGIETVSQAHCLRQNNVGFAQGWLYLRPLPAQESLSFYRQRKERYSQE